MRRRNAFTMIELVFVIVVIGILSAVAFPKLAPILSSAKTAKAKDTLAAVRSSLAIERQKRVLRGDTSQIGDLGDATYAFRYFDGNSSNPVLEYPVKNCASATARSCWNRDGTQTPKTFTYRFGDGTNAVYELKNGRLVCKSGSETACQKLLK